MFIPLSDDNSDQRIRPLVNYALIAVNLLVFFFLQDMGQNYQFSYAFSTVPQEIITGKDIVTRERIVADPKSGMNVRIPGLQRTPLSVYLTLIFSMAVNRLSSGETVTTSEVARSLATTRSIRCFTFLIPW